VARRPTFAESAEKPRLLVCAFAEVPGPTGQGARAEQLLLGFSLHLEVDGLSLKGRNLTHIQRVGAARMLRVPVAELRGAEGTAARGAFADRLGAYRRALIRQLENDQYDVIYAVDLFSAAAVLPHLGRARLVVEVADVPSQSFDARWPVSSRDKDTRAEWEAAERAALKAATLIVAPSRQAARLVTERAADPRRIQVFPRLVDTRVFTPPTVEVDLGDTRTVAFLGGREGGARTAVLQSSLKLLGARAPEARFLLIGTPGRADATLRDVLQKRDLLERATFVDVSAHHELQHAICGADVAVVVADPTALALPHRALEAMACGRAVVVAAAESICRDHLVGEQHARIVPPDAPERIVESVCDLLDDTTARARLGRAAEKQAARFDLGTRLPELAAMLRDATAVAFDAKLPPLDEVTAPAPIARAVPATRAADPPRTASSATTPRPVPLPSTETTSSPAIVAPVGSAPRATLADVDDDVPATAPEADTSASLPEASAEELPIDPLHDASLDNAGLPAVLMAASTSPQPFVRFSAVRGIEGHASIENGDVWAGDTMFDPQAVRAPASDPPPERIKGAMLNTDAGGAFASVPPTIDGVSGARSTSTPGARSLGVRSEADAPDEWSLDTIADASPVEPTRLPSAERRSTTHPPRSFLVQQGIADLTAEDDDE
jgi:glycosyltransferase involved in cell wall biosynthesis